MTVDTIKAHLPASLQGKLDARRYGLQGFVEFASQNTSKGSVVLDAGAGDSPYKHLFPHTRYVSTDFCKVGKAYGRQDAISDLSSLPFKEESFDVVLNTQVLEHVQRPEVVLSELYRVLKPGGALYLSVPQGDPEHEIPHDYFRFTSFGMRYLLEKVRFEVLFVEPRGGYFWLIGNRLRHLPTFLFPVAETRAQRIQRYPRYPLKLIFELTFEILIPLLCFYLDRLDHEKAFTHGYLCYAIKPANVVAVMRIEYPGVSLLENDLSSGSWRERMIGQSKQTENRRGVRPRSSEGSRPVIAQ